MGSGYSTETKDGTLSNGGPTLEEYIAAGYKAEGYPPSGYAEKPSEGLTLYRTTGQLPVTEKPVVVDPPQDLPVPGDEAPPANVLATPDPVADVVPDPLPAAEASVEEVAPAHASGRKRR